MIRACVFDLDGVLVDTMDAHFRAWRLIANELDVELTDRDLQRFRGRTRSQCLDLILANTARGSRAEYDRLLRLKNEHYLGFLRSMGRAIVSESVVGLLRQLRSCGYVVALASASRNAATIIAQAGLGPCFDFVSDGNFVGHPKPAPDQLRLVSDALNCSTSRMAVFDDSPTGIAAAASVGAIPIGVGPAVKDDPALHAWLPSLSHVTFDDLEPVLVTVIPNEA